MSPQPAKETVLVVGATGNIGVSAVIGALRSKRNVLAIVCNQNSADRLVKHVGSSENITFVEADVTSDTGVKGVVDQVRAGKLPAFQPVYSCVAYRDSVGYLIKQNNPASTRTSCTGAQGDIGIRSLPAMVQGALFSMYTTAARELESTNIRLNEIYLSLRVEFDEDAIQHGVTKSSDFAKVYELLLADTQVRGSRVRVEHIDDLTKLRHEKKF